MNDFSFGNMKKMSIHDRQGNDDKQKKYLSLVQ